MGLLRGQCEISFTVNGVAQCINAYPMERLLDVIRQRLGLTGAKEGCGEGECGSCAVLLDGVLVTSCLVPVLQAQGASITTVEGLSEGSQLHGLQQALLDAGGAQCGICTPGFLMAACHLLKRKSQPTREDIKEGLSGNLCRCTGYAQICEAVAEAASRGNAK